jgi:Fe-S-cluster-containing dehydrogenase component
MMMRIHPEHGLWHAYRFALALPLAPAAAETLVQNAASTDLCASCDGQPCLQGCPVGAYTGESFLLETCASHLHSRQGADCMQIGCLARRACPVATNKRYSQEHAAFLMQAFAQIH